MQATPQQLRVEATVDSLQLAAWLYGRSYTSPSLRALFAAAETAPIDSLGIREKEPAVVESDTKDRRIRLETEHQAVFLDAPGSDSVRSQLSRGLSSGTLLLLYHGEVVLPSPLKHCDCQQIHITSATSQQ
ncbi:hypothetical protein BV22DRAFT_11347 [Leucogyrophana mollusca]|uniref:Uncharacterized protein n=1 Tax=Leucogyrophana mollusca TaxID=85980 RepID=A0ACB8BZZ5_9AGAM|nr:hypothetical protein BV22DRAFT_11347 [Leucogyrophana mollusca]